MSVFVTPNGFAHYEGFLDEAAQRSLLKDIEVVTAVAPFYRPTMPRSGAPFSVLMTNCGELGWVSSKDEGYRYQTTHPETGGPWPEIPEAILEIWRQVSQFAQLPEACLINRYAPGTKLGMHVDADEQNTTAPVVSVSLGDDAWFRVGGRKRRDPTTRILLRSGDVVVLGGDARLIYHGIDRILPGTSCLLDEPGRINLTLRRVTFPS